jgi:hypothetical protein
MANTPMLVAPFASGSINWRCLSTAMKLPYETNYPNFYYGNAVCEGGSFAIGAAIAAVLVTVSCQTLPKLCNVLELM